MNDTQKSDKAASGGSPGMACSPSSDTPETAALRAKLFPNTWEESYWAMKNHAEKLERERDEWKEVANGSLLGTVKRLDTALDALKVISVSDWNAESIHPESKP